MKHRELPGPKEALFFGFGLERVNFLVAKAVEWLERVHGTQGNLEAFLKLQYCHRFTSSMLTTDQDNALSRGQKIDWPLPNFQNLA